MIAEAAAHERHRGDQVGGEEGDRHRHAEHHEADAEAEQQRRRGTTTSTVLLRLAGERAEEIFPPHEKARELDRHHEE